MYSGQLEHSVIKLIIFPFLGQKLVVVAPFHDLSVFQNNNGVGIPHCRETMGDNENCPSFHQAVHSLFNKGFGTGVYGGSGLIEDQHRRSATAARAMARS